MKRENLLQQQHVHAAQGPLRPSQPLSLHIRRLQKFIRFQGRLLFGIDPQLCRLEYFVSLVRGPDHAEELNSR